MTPNPAPNAERPEDPTRQALAIGLELAKNAARAATLEDLQFILVNDTRALVPFDRSMLIVHFDGDSKLTAVNNQPALEGKSDFVNRLNNLAPVLKVVTRGLVLFPVELRIEGIPEHAAEALRGYVTYSKCSCLIVLPLSVQDNVVGHLLLEFFGDARPGQIETLTLMNMVPFFSSALAHKWLMENRKAAQRLFMSAISPQEGLPASRRLQIKAAITVGLLILVLVSLWLPVTLRIGGRAEVAPDREYYAFVETDGTVKEVRTRTGAHVKKGDTVAVLDPQEIDYEIKDVERTLESLAAEIEILRNLGAEDSSKLSESQLTLIKRQRAKQKLAFLQWKKQFLDVNAPAGGVVLDEKLESFVGKKFSAGDSFCTVASPERLILEIFVKEADAIYVKPGQTGRVFFNFKPAEGYVVAVENVAPKFEATHREGNAFRVKAKFHGRPPDIKPGMLGIAHIDAGEGSLWFVLTRRLVMRFREVMVMF
jgi:multidrug resistance efflux pump